MPTDLPPYPPLASPYGYSTSLPNGHFGGVPKHQGDSNMESGSGSRIQLGKIEVPQEALLDKDLAPKKARSKRKVGDLKTSSSNSKAALDAEESSGGSADPGEGDGSDGKGIKIEISRWKGRYQAPEAVLLKKPTRGKIPSDAQIKAKCVELEERLASFQIKGTVTDAHVGASLTMYEFQPDPGVKVSKITSLSDDLALMLGASTIRILAPIPGKKTLGIEVPNDEASAVSFSSLLPALLKETKTQELPVALGLDVHNNALVVDLASMPHLLVAGTTGSGKSVFMNALISSLLFTRSPKDLRFIMIDPKMIELSPYNGIPHLLRPVVTDVTEAKNLLVWAEQEMDRRYQMFSDLQARNITSFNEKIGSSTQSQCERRAGKKISWKWAEMPYIVIVIDELADLMLTQGRDVEVPITRIAQKARAAGIHLVIATQRPSADIVTGLIKTNFPTRISFKVSSGIDSRTILDDSGAEKLLGRGDMLLLPNGQAIQRLQGCFLSESEVKKIVQSIS
jgi:S-DNA-T family DNA segregation ATPase FtsK/SpoIIIE